MAVNLGTKHAKACRNARGGVAMRPATHLHSTVVELLEYQLRAGTVFQASYKTWPFQTWLSDLDVIDISFHYLVLHMPLRSTDTDQSTDMNLGPFGGSNRYDVSYSISAGYRHCWNTVTRQTQRVFWKG